MVRPFNYRFIIIEKNILETKYNKNLLIKEWKIHVKLHINLENISSLSLDTNTTRITTSIKKKFLNGRTNEH